MQRLEIVRGTTLGLHIAVRDESGHPYTLEAGEKLLFGVCTEMEDPVIAPIEAEAAADGYDFYLPVEATEDLAPGRYFYDVKLESGADLYPVIKFSPFDVLPSATAKRGGN